MFEMLGLQLMELFGKDWEAWPYWVRFGLFKEGMSHRWASRFQKLSLYLSPFLPLPLPFFLSLPAAYRSCKLSATAQLP